MMGSSQQDTAVLSSFNPIPVPQSFAKLTYLLKSSAGAVGFGSGTAGGSLNVCSGWELTGGSDSELTDGFAGCVGSVCACAGLVLSAEGLSAADACDTSAMRSLGASDDIGTGDSLTVFSTAEGSFTGSKEDIWDSAVLSDSTAPLLSAFSAVETDEASTSAPVLSTVDAV